VAGMPMLLFSVAEKKRITFCGGGHQFSCLPFLLDSPTLTLVTSTAFVCSIILLPGNSFFAVTRLKYIL
jgi:hypothetical protein